MGFTKLDEGILQSSIMAERSDVFKVWIAILASAGSDGIARVSSVFLSSACHLSQRVTDHALEILSAPDPRSRSLADDGRRIRRVDGGYFLTNYEKYREFTYSDNPESVRKREYRSRKREEANPGHSGTCPGHSASASASVLIIFNQGEFEGITDLDRKKWSEAFPACDLDGELKRMASWLIANPSKKKSNYRRFIHNWLSRSQDRGGTKGQAPSGEYQMSDARRRFLEEKD